jgi:pantetheine-phosphate adenylyltransferase
VTVAIYPGSFDPITNGHLDIVKRAARLFDKVIMGIYATPDKRILFTIEERVEMAKIAMANQPNVIVEPFFGLTGEFARKVGAQVMVRGLRMGGDFEWEFNLAMMNRKLFPELELVCFMASVEYQFLSSSLLKEAASLGGDIAKLVPKHVELALKEKFSKPGWQL